MVTTDTIKSAVSGCRGSFAFPPTSMSAIFTEQKLFTSATMAPSSTTVRANTVSCRTANSDGCESTRLFLSTARILSTLCDAYYSYGVERTTLGSPTEFWNMTMTGRTPRALSSEKRRAMPRDLTCSCEAFVSVIFPERPFAKELSQSRIFVPGCLIGNTGRTRGAPWLFQGASYERRDEIDKTQKVSPFKRSHLFT